MCCFWARRSALLAALALVLAQTAPVSADEAEYLDVWSKGYSRFEIDDGDVVAFFTSGVEFDYLGFHASAQELRYNHATKAAIASGDVGLQLDGASASCAVLELDGRLGSAVLRGNVKVVVPPHGIPPTDAVSTGAQVILPERVDASSVAKSRGPLELSCSRAVLSYPTGSLGSTSFDISLSDMDAQLIGPVVVTDDTGRCLRCAAASFDHQRMEVNVPGNFEFEGGSQPLVGNLAADLTSQAVVTGSALRLHLDAEGGLSLIRCTDIEITTASLQAQLADIQASDLSPIDSRRRWQRYDIFTSSLSGVLEHASQPPVSFSVLDLTVHACADGTATASIGGSVAVDSTAARLRAYTLEVTLLADGCVQLNQPFDAVFDLASLSGLEPMSLPSARSSEP